MTKAIVTGACGFIGSCLARRLLREGIEVVGIDNLSSRGSDLNVVELVDKGARLIRCDLSHPAKASEVFARIGPVDAVFHLAAQVAVTTSYLNRRRDFRDNAVLSFNVLEAVKQYTPDAYCLYSSTNKVYGHLNVHDPVGLNHPLDPYTPYGVSKAVGEMYFTEFGRKEIGLTTCSLRQSCIYGPHQIGIEDQGWVAWFAIANTLGLPITIYGDGLQVRDLLYIDDLLDLYLECWRKRKRGVYPVGGGPGNAIDIKTCLEIIEEMNGRQFASINYSESRPGDQPYFVADLSWRLEAEIEWAPTQSVLAGVKAMMGWIKQNQKAIRAILHI
ncbi:SDR family NAD(P)-dependent oxidoreductase [bacterium]|nr:SDR family NAD(P)-dependent oxidoreductase [bacterium]